MLAMFHLDRRSKRARLAVRFFIYGVMTVATVVLSSVIFLWALGYRFDNENRSFEQGGLIQFRSFPNNADIYVNDRKLRSTTPAKNIVSAGDHTIVMQREGYREWRKDVTITAGQLLWLNYTRFIPENITTSAVQSYERLSDVLPSPNRRWMVLQPSANQPNLVIADIRNEQNPRFETIRIPSDAYTSVSGSRSTFRLIEWGLDGRYLLVRHTTKGVNEVIRVDRENPDESINLTEMYGRIGDVHFAGSNAGQVFGIVGSNLLRMNVTREASERVAARVTAFDVYKNDILSYVSTTADEKLVEVSVYKNGVATSVATYPAGSKPKIAINNYYDHDYLAVALGDEVRLFRDPTNTTTTLLRTFREFSVDQPGVEWMYFSNNGRMLVMQHQASFETYDLELDDHYSHEFESERKVTKRFRWLDDYYLWADLGGTLRIIEFDGTNEHVIASVASGFGATLSSDGSALFSIGRNSSNNRFELQRSDLEVN
jgi:hypothetical protein